MGLFYTKINIDVVESGIKCHKVVNFNEKVTIYSLGGTNLENMANSVADHIARKSGD